MKIIKISDYEAGQTLHKMLLKYFNQAGSGFIYKMLRKKNITLNGKKADGKEKLNPGDEIRLFMLDETIEKFSQKQVSGFVSDPSNVRELLKKIEILYEDKNILIVNKPAGMLSQKAKAEDTSLNEVIIEYLIQNGSLSETTLKTFRPSICNRLDRNTSGIVICGKTVAGLQKMGDILKDRSLHKYYRCLVKGNLSEKKLIQGYLSKEEDINTVCITSYETPDSKFIETYYEPVQYNAKKDLTLLEVLLITGRSHQIRAHLASISHPILGDYKYGDRTKKYPYQMLHAYRLVMPEISGELSALSGMTITAPLPEAFLSILGTKEK